MASLTNPIKAENIMARFADYVAATANGSIVWADNANPIYTDPTDNSTHEVIPDSSLGASTSGISPTVIGSADGTLIRATDVVTALVNETNRYRNIRQVRARLNVTGAGGNKPAGPVNVNTANNSTPLGVVYDDTQVAYVTDTYRTGVIATTSSPNPADYNIADNQKISVTNLQSYMDALKTAYTTARDTSTDITTDVCHASCHTSCHSSRSRR